jgi:enoyl-CoA hydratase/carnithine racemase
MTITVERAGHVATIRIDRPEKHNPLSAATWKALGDAVSAASGDDGLRAVVVRGAGGRAFSAGADIAEFEETRGSAAAAREYGALINGCMAALLACRHPIVAAIEGLCVGGGVEIATHCDLRYANRSARFGVPVKRLGLSVDLPEMAALVRLVGPSVALELLLEGRILDADEALSKGLVNRVFADEAFESALGAALERITSGAPLVARLHKRMVARLTAHPFFESAERDETYALFDTQDYRAGYRAFLSKTNPVFQGS